MILSIVLVIQINKLDNQGIIDLVSTFLFGNIDITLDSIYVILQNCISILFILFYNILFSTSIKSTSNI